jgi:FkbM family methyltransferase
MLPANFFCPEGLRDGCEEVFNGEYDIPTLTFEKLGQPPVILDLGANIGAFTRRALALWPDAKVIAYEPHPVNARFFRLNCPSVELHEVAVVNTRGEPCTQVTLFDGISTGQASLDCRGGQKADEALTVAAMQASSLPECDLLKIDTEGCELPILFGYPHLAGVKAVALEFHYWADQFYIGAHLAYGGFRCVGQKVDAGRNSGVLLFVRQEFREQCRECRLDDGRRRGYRMANGMFGCIECEDTFA